MNEDYLTPEAIELIERAKALAPTLAERAFAADHAGRVSDETVADIARAGLFRILQPKRWGGYEMDPRVFYRVQMALAEGCMSTAWIYGVIGVHNWELPLYGEQAQQDVWGKDSSTRIASTYMPVGKAEKVEGGYRFSGRWGFSSGVEHCDWIFLGALLPKADATLKSLQLDDDLRGAFILAADTVVAVGRRILPKAELVDEASQCLRLLSGRNHRVYTAICLVTPKEAFRQRLIESRVRFKRLTEDDIQAYIGSGEWRGKAGGYAVQGIAGSFVVKMVGSYTNIVGLPLYESIALLGGEGFPVRFGWLNAS